MERFEKIRSRLGAYGLDAMMFSGEANRFYVSGLKTTGEDGMAVVTGKNNYYLTDSRYIEIAEKTVKNAKICLVDTGKSYVDWLREIVEAEGVERLGFEEKNMTVWEHEQYGRKLDCLLIGASELPMELRMSKDEEEIKAMKMAQSIAESALDQLLGEIQYGMKETEIAAKLQFLMISKGAEKCSFDTIVASGPNSSMPHAVPTERRIEKGDFLTIDFGCVYKGYCSDMTRTFALGYATEEMRRVYEIVLEAQLAGISAAKAGEKGKNVDKAARDIIEKAGYGECFGHGLGHGLGIEIHENPRFSPSYEAEIPCGAVLSVEPGIYLPGRFGVRIEDMVWLKKDGKENLMSMDKTLQIL